MWEIARHVFPHPLLRNKSRWFHAPPSTDGPSAHRTHQISVSDDSGPRLIYSDLSFTRTRVGGCTFALLNQTFEKRTCFARDASVSDHGGSFLVPVRGIVSIRVYAKRAQTQRSAGTRKRRGAERGLAKRGENGEGETSGLSAVQRFFIFFL